jgi:hypothetical protein
VDDEEEYPPPEAYPAGEVEVDEANATGDAYVE